MTPGARRATIAPPRLRRGDRIELIAPSGTVNRRLALRGARRLVEAGFRVTLGRHLFDRRGHLAGADRARADDLNRAFRNPDVRCVLMARGGYGVLRIGADVDWDAARRDPKIYAGFSDATYLHLGLARHANLRTLHGPNAQGFGGRSIRELKRWIEWVTSPRPDDRWRILPARGRLEGTKGGAISGRVVGGNLVLLHYAAMTNLTPSLRGSILFLEEVNEAPYRVDGLLAALQASGALAGIRGVAIGGFTNCVPQTGHRELPLRTVLRDHLAPLGVPVLMGIPAGHGGRNAPFPLGARATLDPRKSAVVFDEGLVS